VTTIRRYSQIFCFERFLYRLSVSPIRDRFVLKGAMLLRVWSHQPYRATRDLDLLRRGVASIQAIQEDIGVVCTTPVEADGIVYGADSVLTESIRAEDEYAGVRATLAARCDSARMMLQIDMGVGDSVWPTPQKCVYPTLLEFAAPEVLVYPREAVVAEKLDAMIVLGDRNSRIKDFFDVYHLASEFEFDRFTLSEAVRRTLVRRQTPIPQDAPIALTPAHWDNPTRTLQVRAFARRARISVPENHQKTFSDLLGSFLTPSSHSRQVYFGQAPA
jgi:hypothetical protein